MIENPSGDDLVRAANPISLKPPPPSVSLSPLTPAQLLFKLRWANIGRSYHWGAKAYDFSKELAPFPQDVLEVSKRVVEMVPWNTVWNATGPPDGDTVADDEWGQEGPDWVSWPESYGTNLSSIRGALI